MHARSAFFAVVLFVIGPRALAFSGPEHRDLSNLALRAALASDAGSKTIRDKGEKLLCEPPCEGTFGELVAAVDGFTNPENHLAIAKAWSAVHDRQKQPLFHLIALHRNSTHFQGEALTHYATNHANAIAVAASDPVLALHREAVALHFLEDALSAGHIVTPRRGMPNAVSGSLHDVINHSGAVVQLDVDDAKAWERVIGLLKTIDRPPPRSSVLFVKDAPEMTLQVTEVEALAKRLASPSSETFYGDALLNNAKASAQKVAILALAAQSLMDVLSASIETPKRVVQACFTPRNVEVGKGFQNLSPFAGPTGAFFLADFDQIAWDADHRWVVLRHCKPLPVFVRYDVHQTRGFEKMLYHFPGYSAAAYVGIGTKSGARRIVIEGSRIFAASDPARGVMKRKENGEVTNEPWRRRFGNVGASMNASFVRGSNYWGFGIMGEGRNSFFGKDGFTIGPRLGVRHYQGDQRTVQAVEYGGKLTAGTGVLDVTLVIDRGTSFRDDGSSISEFVVVGGIDITVSRGWLSLLGRRMGIR